MNHLRKLNYKKFVRLCLYNYLQYRKLMPYNFYNLIDPLHLDMFLQGRWFLFFRYYIYIQRDKLYILCFRLGSNLHRIFHSILDRMKRILNISYSNLILLFVRKLFGI